MATRISRAVNQQVSWPILPGTYLLVLRATTPVSLSVGRLGTFALPAGFYGYVGSAHGPGGLAARLARHLQPHKQIHWHIDALTALLPIVAIQATTAAERLECDWVQRLLAQGASAPIPGFGSSDCRAGCPAHLLRLPEQSGLTENKSENFFQWRQEAAS